jgi:1-acyl-sn-glycerol-3-phosphate acyltransferase
MDSLPYATPPRWWSPTLRPFFVRAIRPLRLWRMRRIERVREVEVRGVEPLREAVSRDQGVVITPNHAAHSDPFVLLRAQDEAGVPFYYMVAWQSFQILDPVSRWVIQRHGSFSVDREGSDLRAFRRSVEVVRDSRHPLVIFAEGEVYHNGDQVTPFRQGAAAIALAAARKARRPVVCFPAAIRYRYVEDPTPELLPLLDAMERRFLWHPRRGVPLAERVARLAEAVVSLREVEFLGRAQSGPFPQRVAALIEAVLRPLEQRHGAPPDGTDVPDRVTRLRRAAIQQKEGAPVNDPARAQAARDLDALLVVVQLYSYANDYRSDEPSIEHVAEIVDKFEEDILGVVTAKPRASRRAVIQFGEPVPVAPFRERNDGTRALTEALEGRVRGLLGELMSSQGTAPRRAVEELTAAK